MTDERMDDRNRNALVNQAIDAAYAPMTYEEWDTTLAPCVENMRRLLVEIVGRIAAGIWRPAPNASPSATAILVQVKHIRARLYAIPSPWEVSAKWVEACELLTVVERLATTVLSLYCTRDWR